MIINRIAVALIIVTAILIPAVTVQAQTENGTITGVVLDRMGHNIPNATVSLLRDGQLVDTFQNPQQSIHNHGGKTRYGGYGIIHTDTRPTSP